jgi:hypothetical protein
MTQQNKIRMRGHHLFCETISNHEDKSVWSREFCINMCKYQNMMRSNDNQVIEIVFACGDTCGRCPNNTDGKCELYDFGPGDNGIDIRVLHRLGYKVGQEITFGELKKRVKEAYGTELPTMCFTECGLSPVLECADGLKNL